jgi:hypothetical protein
MIIKYQSLNSKLDMVLILKQESAINKQEIEFKSMDQINLNNLKELIGQSYFLNK